MSVALVGCGHDHTHDHNHHEVQTGDTTPEIVLDIPNNFARAHEYEPLTVNGQAINIAGTRLVSWSQLEDVVLDKTADYFDQVNHDKVSNYSGYKLIHTVPSLDTPVCTKQTKELEAASKLFPTIPFLIISNDTPFALQRFCLSNNIDNIQVLSDARTREFGIKNGLFMPNYGLLTRTIMIVDEEMNVVYVDYAEEVTHELDLINALAYLKHLTTQATIE